MISTDNADLVTVTIHPSGGDDYPISASDFIKQVDSLRQLLSLVGNPEGAETNIVKLHMNSPATVVMAPSSTPMHMQRLFEGLKLIANEGVAPSDFSRPVFDALKEFAAVIGKGVRASELNFAGMKILIDTAARKKIESVFGADTAATGSVDGMLEAINVHGKKNTFALYPIVGAARVTCKFDEELLTQVRPALGKYVIIQGELKYRWREKFPYEAIATKIEIAEDWADQPSFTDILGMAPLATNNIPSEEFVKSVRHGW